MRKFEPGEQKLLQLQALVASDPDFTFNDSHTVLTYENTEVDNNDGNGSNPAIFTNTFSVNALTYETLNMSLINSSAPNVISSELILSRF